MSFNHIVNQEIKKFVESNNICLYHFTPMQNIFSICSESDISGIMTRPELDSFGIKYEFNDKLRLNFKNGICLSIDHVDMALLSTYLKKHKVENKNTIFAILEVDKSILYKKECCFFENNSASSKYSNIDHLTLKSYDPFKKMYNARYVNDKKQSIFVRRMNESQAEVICFEKIPKKCIKKIIVENMKIKEYLVNKQITNIGISVDKFSNI